MFNFPKKIIMAFTVGTFAIVLWFAYSNVFQTGARNISLERRSHKIKSVSALMLRKVSGMSDDEELGGFKNYLRPFLRIRVPDTEGNTAVREHIELSMTDLGWDVGLDSFEGTTPLGVKHFTNIVATSNPHSRRHLVLACHFDSKYFTSFQFIGASDSAVPCAIMLAIAEQLKDHIDKTSRNIPVGLKFIFFDGEEAFGDWSSSDSLYGARHLAERMERESVRLEGGVNVTKLQQIDLFVLLDLIGTIDTSFVPFNNPDKFYSTMRSAESRLRHMNLLNHSGLRDGADHKYFKQTFHPGARIEDDHIPFLQRGVPVLHLISYPFPRVWHTEADKESNLHCPTINNIMKCIRLFVIEYLGINIQ